MDESRIKVSRERWADAQRWECTYWTAKDKVRRQWHRALAWRLLSCLGLKPAYRGDDWNQWWCDQFNGYRFLPAQVENAVELGCGPYTNLRLIQSQVRMRHLFLSDPLMRTYVTFRHTFVAEMARRGLAILDDHPAEDCPFAEAYFDLVVMINVLDHVMDARRCLRVATTLAKPGGFILIGQELSDDEDARRVAQTIVEHGHPIKIKHEWMDEILAPVCEPVLRTILPREHGRNPSFHYGTYVYAGRKKPADRIGGHHA